MTLSVFKSWMVLLMFILSHSLSSSTVTIENITYLENCYFSKLDYDNNLNTHFDSPYSISIQAIYSLFTHNQLVIPGQIYKSLAVIPFLVKCSNYYNISKTYLPFTSCLYAIIDRNIKLSNHEYTRTLLELKQIESWNDDVPILYLGENRLLLCNCSFQSNNHVYQLSSSQIFSLKIEFEAPVNQTCSITTKKHNKCNSKTSYCQNGQCQCRIGTIMRSIINNDNKIKQSYCIDNSNCTLDHFRCIQWCNDRELPSLCQCLNGSLNVQYSCQLTLDGLCDNISYCSPATICNGTHCIQRKHLNKIKIFWNIIATLKFTLIIITLIIVFFCVLFLCFIHHNFFSTKHRKSNNSLLSKTLPFENNYTTSSLFNHCTSNISTRTDSTRADSDDINSWSEKSKIYQITDYFYLNSKLVGISEKMNTSYNGKDSGEFYPKVIGRLDTGDILISV